MSQSAPRQLEKNPTIGMVSLGCPKALVDSERILTTLKSQGYGIIGSYEGADTVIVNTCGFLDSAKAESLEAIGEAISANGRVIVTGCMGANAKSITDVHPKVLAVTGPHAYNEVVAAVHAALPPKHEPYLDLIPPQGIRLTPRHFAYLKISEGCNHSCRFCIIPSMRGKLASRPIHHILHEAEKLVENGCQELLVISQDTSAYGLDRRYETQSWKNRDYRTHITDLARHLGEFGVWVRMHYVYPYPHVDDLIPLMSEGLILPYLDIPFQHSSPTVLANMRRPAHQDKTLNRIEQWRQICPDMAIRSSMIVGFPGETDDDFEHLLSWLRAAKLDRVGCFKYENVKGARANDLPDHIAEELKEERWHRLMETQREISAAKLQDRIGVTYEVVVDDITDDGQAIARSFAEAPEIDGQIIIAEGDELQPGDMLEVEIDRADDYDLFVD